MLNWFGHLEQHKGEMAKESIGMNTKGLAIPRRKMLKML